MDGIINILKPTGMTSHDVVKEIKKITNIKKVGHTGTLDPNAAGVLPICIGKATKVSEFLLNKEKIYRAELTLGIETDTYDSFGNILSRKDISSISENDILTAFKQFKGEILQVPPIYSAIKVKGKKLYELARQGIDNIDVKPRKVFIKKIDVLNIDKNKVLFDLVCSKGTYVRSICKDIGDELGCGGHMSFLLRTSSGPFNLKNSVTLENLKKHLNRDIREYLFNIDFCLKDYKRINLKESALKSFINGATVSEKGIITSENYFRLEDELVRVYCDNIFYGIAKVTSKNPINIKSFKLFV
ncbi:tRNA pseudouridine55 synthase [Alkalithermobacter thermoalcaliphilus JW-YL-7 = DSM 7308]|uniref:tRNA pseudouridine synthase B n=1 Tax=Alkalithermobacter thermoalcaliphilus JW-YL-7 = DSM 7308 TaxID=1121328 RepID=A0A150FQH0_CLOPD|nr:tRNA pseudouridine synthase B [[Clostridium] paradoxum JW-YL-7 = DSM 7308]SHK59458.1 tRNA pseudouridine55 synthase [[Clostridium] paradoxum JW-YL-7 = DSM 7308]